MSKQLAHCSKSKRQRSDDGGRNLKHQSDPKKSQTKVSSKQKPNKNAERSAAKDVNDDAKQVELGAAVSTINDKPLGHVCQDGRLERCAWRPK